MRIESKGPGLGANRSKLVSEVDCQHLMPPCGEK